MNEPEYDVVDDIVDDLVVEEIDDTPENDQGRTAIDHDPTDEEHTQDDANLSAEAFKKRVDKLTHAVHTERREKEARARELAQSVEYARRLMAERDQARRQASVGERAYVQQVQTNVDHELKRASDAMQAAYESGDSAALVAANVELTKVISRKQVVDTYQPLVEEEEEIPVIDPVQPQAPQQQQIPAARAAWFEKNKWFFSDKVKNAQALEIHQALVEDGVVPDSPMYYRELDRQMAPHIAPAPTQRAASAPVASGRTAQRPASRKVQLTKAEVNLAKLLGITPEQYARERLKLEQSE